MRPSVGLSIRDTRALAVELYNNLGSPIISEVDYNNSGKIDVNLRNLLLGLYFIKFMSDCELLLNTKLLIVK